MSKPRNYCIFDGRTPLSKEHIFADWLEPYIPRTMKAHDFSKTIMDLKDAKTTYEKRTGDIHARRVRRVCVHCNTQWMSQIQNDVKPILVPMLKGDTQRLNLKSQRLLSAWIAMAAMVAEFTAGESAAIPQADRDWLMARKQPPSHWRILIGNYKRGSAWRGYYVRNALPLHREGEPQAHYGGLPPPNTQTTTMVVGQVYFHVMTSTIARRMIKRWRFPPAVTPLLSQIWPASPGSLRWPPAGVMTDDDAHIVANDFFSRIVKTFEASHGVHRNPVHHFAPDPTQGGTRDD